MNRDLVFVLLGIIIGLVFSLAVYADTERNRSKEYKCIQSQSIEDVDLCTLFDFDGQIVASADGIIFTKD